MKTCQELVENSRKTYSTYTIQLFFIFLVLSTSMAYEFGDIVWAIQSWEENGEVKWKERRMVIVDVIGEELFSVGVFTSGRNWQKGRKGIQILAQSSEGKRFKLDHDSFIDCSRKFAIRRIDIRKWIAACPEAFMIKVEELISD